MKLHDPHLSEFGHRFEFSDLENNILSILTSLKLLNLFNFPIWTLFY